MSRDLFRQGAELGVKVVPIICTWTDRRIRGADEALDVTSTRPEQAPAQRLCPRPVLQPGHP